MNIKRNGWLFRWAYLFETGGRPTVTTDICTLFWRCVLLSPVKVSGVAFVCIVSAIGGSMVLFWVPGHMIYSGWVVAGALWVAAETLLILWIADATRRDLDPEKENTLANVAQLVRGFVAAKKGPFCPLVDIK